MSDADDKEDVQLSLLEIPDDPEEERQRGWDGTLPVPYNVIPY